MFTGLKRIVYQVTDIEKAKQWYCGILDRPPIFDTPFAAIFVVGECTLSLAQCDSPLSEAQQRVDTYWEVEDIDASYQRLIEAGAKVHTPIKDVLNIRIARVVDPFGNIVGITGVPPDATKRSVEERPSATALSAAFCRALAAKDEREEIRGPDYLAECFLTDEGKKPLHNSVSRRWAIDNLVTSPLYGYFIARTAFIDALFRKSLSENLPQIVLLGAGYDTRAYRYRDMLGKTRVYELDISTTQKRKRYLLQSADIGVPRQVSFVTINFKVDNIEEVLSNAGFDNTAKTLFIWEGVTYYLAEETVKHTLSVVQTRSQPGSTLCFAYLTERLDSVNPAEPFRFWTSSHDLLQLLGEKGFDVVEHVDAKEMARRYLTLRDGTQAEKVLTQFCLVYGRTSG
jgi:methyltransferase (TIGR00027 family)